MAEVESFQLEFKRTVTPRVEKRFQDAVEAQPAAGYRTCKILYGELEADRRRVGLYQKGKSVRQCSEKDGYLYPGGRTHRRECGILSAWFG